MVAQRVICQIVTDWFPYPCKPHGHRHLPSQLPIAIAVLSNPLPRFRSFLATHVGHHQHTISPWPSLSSSEALGDSSKATKEATPLSRQNQRKANLLATHRSQPLLENPLPASHYQSPAARRRVVDSSLVWLRRTSLT